MMQVDINEIDVNYFCHFIHKSTKSFISNFIFSTLLRIFVKGKQQNNNAQRKHRKLIEYPTTLKQCPNSESRGDLMNQ